MTQTPDNSPTQRDQTKEPDQGQQQSRNDKGIIDRIFYIIMIYMALSFFRGLF
jgi:hypothetical protein